LERDLKDIFPYKELGDSKIRVVYMIGIEFLKKTSKSDIKLEE
jgi:hypothetical protein